MADNVVRTGGELPPTKRRKEALGYFSTLELTRVLSKHCVTVLTPPSPFPTFYATSLGLLRTKITSLKL